MPLYHILSLSACAPLWKMSRKKVNNLSTKKEVYQFQVACVSYMSLRKNKEFKEQIGKCLSQQFDVKTPQQTRKKLKQDNTHVI